MKTKIINMKIEVSVPYDRPDLNGVHYSKESIDKMLQQLKVNKPIVFRSNTDDKLKLIGQTVGGTQELLIDLESGICKFKIDGILYCGNVDIKVNKFHQEKGSNVVIDDFDINDIGIS